MMDLHVSGYPLSENFLTFIFQKKLVQNYNSGDAAGQTGHKN